MACRLFIAKPLSEPIPCRNRENIFDWHHLNQNIAKFIQDISVKNIARKMAVSVSASICQMRDYVHCTWLSKIWYFLLLRYCHNNEKLSSVSLLQTECWRLAVLALMLPYPLQLWLQSRTVPPTEVTVEEEGDGAAISDTGNTSQLQTINTRLASQAPEPSQMPIMDGETSIWGS